MEARGSEAKPMNNHESRIVKDPICGKEVDTLRARAVGIFGGVTYYFCSQECKAKFTAPRQSVGSEAIATERRVSPPPPSPPPSPPPVATTTPATSTDEPMQKARSPIRPTNGEAGTPVVAPVVQIAPSPSPEAEAEADDGEPLDRPARRSRGWLVVIVMLIIAGGVILFTLRTR
jgi:YHS domain-containing protein